MTRKRATVPAASRRGIRHWEIPRSECVVIGANIRALRHGKGWTQETLGELMGWQSNSTVCAAEGRRDGRQRGFTVDEVRRLAEIFGVPEWRLRSRCANCEGSPPDGFACLSCGARGTVTPPRPIAGGPRRPGPAATQP